MMSIKIALKPLNRRDKHRSVTVSVRRIACNPENDIRAANELKRLGDINAASDDLINHM